MATTEGNEQRKIVEIDPTVGRFIDVLDTAEKIAKQRYGTSIDGLRQLGEPTDDYSKIQEVVHEADRIVGPEDQFVSDFKIWQETRQSGTHELNFHEWKMARNQAYREEYERLNKELGGEQ